MRMSFCAIDFTTDSTRNWSNPFIVKSKEEVAKFGQNKIVDPIL